MREIKFRVRYADGDGWYVFEVPTDFLDCERRLFDWKTLCGYTGLKDKHGREIYEGDIVKHLFNNQLTQIVFYKGAFHFQEENSVLSCIWPYMVTRQIEVIGNIHENPEMIQ